MELACASIPRLHMSNPAPSLNFTAPWCWCRCWQPQAPSQAPSSTALPTLPTDRHPKPHPDTPTARSCLLPGPPPSRTDFAGFPRAAPGHARWESEHRSSFQSSPRLTTRPQTPRCPSPSRRAASAEPGPRCQVRFAAGLRHEAGARRELSCRPGGHSQPGTGHSKSRTHHSFLGIAEAEQRRRRLRAPSCTGMLGLRGAFARQLYLQVRPSTSFTRIRTTESLAEMPGLSVSPPPMLPLCNVYSCSPVSSPSDIFMVAIGTNENQIKKK